MNNPFQPPRSGFEKPPRDREPGSLFKAVVVGVAIDIGGTIAGGLILGILYHIAHAARGLSSAQIQALLETANPFDTFRILGMALGLAMSVLGGFFCARTANVNSYTAVGIVSAISVTVGTLNGAGEYDWSTLLVLNLLGLVCIFVGGWWFIRKLETER